jgi:ATP-dependent Lhr-like helicase
VPRDESLEDFHPAIREWFHRRFPGGPTEAQGLAWGPIANGEDTLIAAPTGSGKTLAAFLVAIDRCLRVPSDKWEDRGTSVVYVSPLRALTVDIQQNLETPLREIMAIIAEQGGTPRPIRVAVRNGDTPASARAAMLKNRPEIIVTTPESLYLLLTARRGRELLGNVSTVIVDEIHALARDKRGSHLALSLERLDALVENTHFGPRPTRIGCSATQRPIEKIARLLVGAGSERSLDDGRAKCHIVDVGHLRKMDVQIELIGDELGAVTTTEQLDELVGVLAAQIRAHHTTLVFVNTRKMSERMAHLLATALGDESVSAHHGSLSSDRRLAVEQRLRDGSLAAVVATASLELGIDVGPIDCVCQIGSPRSIATFLQRVGRAEHRLDGIPKGRLYPLTRNELVECVALLGAIHDGVLDAVSPPVAPLDILAQQIVAECAAVGEKGIKEDELFALVKHAAPYAQLSLEDFDSVVDLLSRGVATGRGMRGAHIHRDVVHDVLRPRRGARLAATTSGGAIPELADYRVIAEPDGAVIGTVHEDFAVEAMVGDVFLLGSTSWRVRHVEQGTVRVAHANGAAPTIPFWLGEAPARTNELSDALSNLLAMVDHELEQHDENAARKAVRAWTNVADRVAAEVVSYLAAGRAQLGGLPTKDEVVFERFFDDTGGMQLVVHSLYGARINRGLGLALRKRFCRSFDFELQAAASDDAVVLSLGPQHSFPLEEVPRYLAPQTVRELLIQAVLPTPIFTARWRWNLGRSLVSPRFRGARHLPPAIQRMEADDLMAAIFPALAACQENVSGPIAIPDHPIVKQTLLDCMTEAMDLDGLLALVRNIHSGAVRARCIDSNEPSLLCHEILNGRPYTFLDDAPLEERRSRAVSLRRGIPVEIYDHSALDESVIDQVQREVVPDPRSAEELHDVLHTVIVSTALAHHVELYEALASQGRAMTVTVFAHQTSGAPRRLWCATERRREVEALFPGVSFHPDHPLPEKLKTLPVMSREEVLIETVRGHLEFCGPVRAQDLGLAFGDISPRDVETALYGLEASGAVLRVGSDMWCARRLLVRIHALQRDQSRSRVTTVPAQHLVRFLLSWQHVTQDSKVQGVGGLSAIIGQLQGLEAPVASWEGAVLPSRVVGYHSQLLDELCSSGEVSWGRLCIPMSETSEITKRSNATPSRATPIALFRRDDLTWLFRATRSDRVPKRPERGAAGEVLEVLERRGALFFSDLCNATGRLPVDIADAIWDGVARGLLTADGFQAVRALLSGRYKKLSGSLNRRRFDRGPSVSYQQLGRARRGHLTSPTLAGGRWSILEDHEHISYAQDELAEAIGAQLLDRWGIVFRDLIQREPLALPWRDVLFALRRFEARGTARGGYFVSGFSGEQFALPEALDALHAVASRPLDGELVQLSAADPLNLTGIIVPGARVPAVYGRVVTYSDGLPIDQERRGSPNTRTLEMTRS